jgi:hypothetical protein
MLSVPFGVTRDQCGEVAADAVFADAVFASAVFAEAVLAEAGPAEAVFAEAGPAAIAASRPAPATSPATLVPSMTVRMRIPLDDWSSGGVLTKLRFLLSYVLPLLTDPRELAFNIPGDWRMNGSWLM